MASNTQYPRRLLHCLGCVNEGEFLGFAEGTLLLAGAKLTRSSWTLKPRAGLPGGDLESEFSYDVEFLMSYFNPNKGYTGNPPAVITTDLGHNNFPYRGVSRVLGVNVIDQQATLWFKATAKGSAAYLYKYIPFSTMFDCPQNPV